MEINQILKKNNFRFTHSLGQNFLFDEKLLAEIVSEAGITAEDTVFEIGTGAGTLTLELAKRARKVVTFEVDKKLEPILNEVLAGAENIELIFKDVLKMKDEELLKLAGGSFKLVANLPYYITTPLIMRFIKSGLPLLSLTVTVQKEVAERLTAKENTPAYGAITVAVQSAGDASVLRIIDKTKFYPMPKVDSAVIRIDINRNKFNIKDTAFFERVVRCAFQMRRKTLSNNLVSGFGVSKEEAQTLLTRLGLNPNIRGEALSVAQFISLSEILHKPN